MNQKRIGEKLRALRGARKQKEVARAVNVSASAMGMYEQGRRVPRDGVKVRLAAYYGVSVQELFY